jgi:hypothetical protein
MRTLLLLQASIGFLAAVTPMAGFAYRSTCKRRGRWALPCHAA